MSDARWRLLIVLIRTLGMFVISLHPDGKSTREAEKKWSEACSVAAEGEL